MLPTRKRVVLTIVVVLAGILAAVCFVRSDTAPSTKLNAPISSDSDSASASVTTDAVQNGPMAVDFTMTLYNVTETRDDTQEISLSKLQGRPVIINFWAPLCPPCRSELPDFQKLWEEIQAIGSDAMVLGLDVGSFTGLGDRQESIDFLGTIDLTYPTGQPASADIIRDYKVLGMPTTVFVYRNGTIMRTWTGAITGNKIREITQELIGQ